MKKKLHFDIYTDGLLNPILCGVIGKHNSGKEKTDLTEIDLLIFSLERDLKPEITVTTKYREPFELCVFENDVLVCMISEREMYSLELDENVIAQRNGYGALVD